MSKDQFHFSISERKVYLRALDVVFIITGLSIFSYVFDFEYFNFNNHYLFIWLLVLVVYYYFFGEVFELFDLKVASDRYSTFRSLVITVFFTTLFYVFTPKISPNLPDNRLQIVYFSFTIFMSVLLNRLIYIQFIFAPIFLKNILLIGDANSIDQVLTKVTFNKANHFVGYVSNNQLTKYPLLNYTAIENVNIESLIKEKAINEILICSTINNQNAKKLNAQLIASFEKGVSIKSADLFLENELFKISENQLVGNFYNYFYFSQSHQNNLYLAFRRIIDIILSVFGITFLVVFVPFIFLLNLIGNRGPLFYTQKRVGKHAVEFKIIKFRSMVSNAENNGAVWAQKGDVRITPFGRILRKSRLDEVPQFINVFKGEMSLIGPRPERPEFVYKLEEEIPYYGLRHVVKPGLTGWAQVMHPYAGTVKDQQEKLWFDLYYIKERNLMLDFKIVIKTISTVLFFRGT
ncbi:exopolysaccharide biosynthesis polyprenyl glycosylphosphotransferase [Lutibacter sp. HS1-25]|uniref:exopolysaccharide biosynthesis polyprenyl glycosylphosphotransferase n=1 Tax=Lutibacter sp. HS1-25 TaxID=2485000 RepID=UPI0010132B39|nr:exopolysaccharide biosynthesis polyprenyl glycosylphosphotransferase [Lutibacter sp. HS1-25]RXP44843.1 exopolysaccharide biosynthesis polyprenyl glycosylphosphotransferase [Lutibacter sp. HS1-25]